MVSGISLANKCQLLFGCAVVAILAAVLSVPWLGANALVSDYQLEVSRQIADAWLADRIELGTLEPAGSLSSGLGDPVPGEKPEPMTVSFVRIDDIEFAAGTTSFIGAATQRFGDDPTVTEHVTSVRVGGSTIYRYARAIRESRMRAIRDRSFSVFDATAFEPSVADPLRAVLVIDRTTQFAEGQVLRSRIFIVTALIVGGLLSMLVFYFILTKLIFSPVRRLRDTADKVQAGNLEIRSSIRTGDEFEQLAEAFNTMLDRVQQGQAQLQSINESLDLKVYELAEANVGLYESNRLKSEFLANVSHELRTPLNSIIGFTELLEELARTETAADPKRQRYLRNIWNSGRALLEMINELLDMAKIEAGRVEVSIEQTSVPDLLEGLSRIMGPQAEAKGIELRTQISERVPIVESDPGKLQQILYNFLSNAVKFTPAGGTITLSAERVTLAGNTLGVRIAVIDTGPGIPADLHDVIFEKFRQADAGHTREHPGTGLGLAICRELARLVGATVSYSSTPGGGATFYVEMPLSHQPDEPQPLMA